MRSCNIPQSIQWLQGQIDQYSLFFEGILTGKFETHWQITANMTCTPKSIAGLPTDNPKQVSTLHYLRLDRELLGGI